MDFFLLCTFLLLILSSIFGLPSLLFFRRIASSSLCSSHWQLNRSFDALSQSSFVHCIASFTIDLLLCQLLASFVSLPPSLFVRPFDCYFTSCSVCSFDCLYLSSFLSLTPSLIRFYSFISFRLSPWNLLLSIITLHSSPIVRYIVPSMFLHRLVSALCLFPCPNLHSFVSLALSAFLRFLATFTLRWLPRNIFSSIVTLLRLLPCLCLSSYAALIHYPFINLPLPHFIHHFDFSPFDHCIASFSHHSWPLFLLQSFVALPHSTLTLCLTSSSRFSLFCLIFT